jgi:hypothetical protein
MKPIKTALIAVAVATASLFAQDLPICEEFHGEANIHCFRTEDRAIVISRHSDGGMTFELYTKNGKAYVETDGEGGIFANTSNTQINLYEVDEDKEETLQQVIAYVADEIKW